jgi:hypothetical protein
MTGHDDPVPDAADTFARTLAAGGSRGLFDAGTVPVLTGGHQARAAARGLQRFSHSAPGRVPVPAKTDLRSLRRLPIETDPPAAGRLRPGRRDRQARGCGRGQPLGRDEKPGTAHGAAAGGRDRLIRTWRVRTGT